MELTTDLDRGSHTNWPLLVVTTIPYFVLDHWSGDKTLIGIFRLYRAIAVKGLFGQYHNRLPPTLIEVG